MDYRSYLYLIPSTASAATIATTAVTSTAAASLFAVSITDQLPAVMPPMSVIDTVAAFSVKHFVCSRPIGQHNIYRFILVSQGCHEGFVATDHLDAQKLASSNVT